MNFILTEVSSTHEPMNVDEGEPSNESEESESIDQLRDYLIEKLSHLNLSEKGVKKIGDLPIAANGGFSDIYRGSYRRKEVAIKVARQAVPVDERTLNV